MTVEVISYERGAPVLTFPSPCGQNEDGLTPLHFAEAFSEDISPYLLEQGAFVLAKSSKGVLLPRPCYPTL